MELSQAAGALRASIEALGEFFDVCLIDTAPSLGVAMTAAVLAADYMLSPIEMEAYSLQGMKKMVIIGNLRKQNPAALPRHGAEQGGCAEAAPRQQPGDVAAGIPAAHLPVQHRRA
jgi:MinD superfamily P-loop ATPase